MFVCHFCGSEYLDLTHVDHSTEGFFCDECDSFTYFENSTDRHRFLLLLEEHGNKNTQQQKATYIKKHLSPLRYPGGKGKLISFLEERLQSQKRTIFVEPYAGSASVGLGLLEGKLIDHLILNDMDYGIYALFECIKKDPSDLINLIQTRIPTHTDFFQYRDKIQNGYKNCSLLEAAWTLLVVNRLSFSGISKANPLGGKNGTSSQLLSRWNTKCLINRIQKIYTLGDKISVTHLDALEVIEDYYWTPNATLFLDPPYFKKGKQVYTHYYNEAQHRDLAETLFSLSTGCPGADILLTYDNEMFIRDLYWWAPIENIKQNYSIRHH